MHLDQRYKNDTSKGQSPHTQFVKIDGLIIGISDKTWMHKLFENVIHFILKQQVYAKIINQEKLT